MTKLLVLASIFLSTGVEAQVIEDVCYTPTVAADSNGGSLDYSVSKSGRVRFDLHFYNTALHMSSAMLFYSIDRTLPRLLSDLDYEALNYKLRVPISVFTDDTGDSSAEFEMRRDFDDFGLLIALDGPSLGKVASCGALLFINIHSKAILAAREGEIEF